MKRVAYPLKGFHDRLRSFGAPRVLLPRQVMSTGL